MMEETNKPSMSEEDKPTVDQGASPDMLELSLIPVAETEQGRPAVNQSDLVLPGFDDKSPNKGSTMEMSYQDFSLDTSPAKKRKIPILGNSASGKLIPPRRGLGEKYPKAIFSSAVKLPSLKESESHKIFKSSYEGKNPTTFDVLSYKGYDKKNFENFQAEGLGIKRKNLDFLDSRYRHLNPLKQEVNLTWKLHNTLKWQRGGELVLRDFEHPEVMPDKKCEYEHINDLVEVSDEEEPYESEPKELIGSKAVSDFYTHYRVIKKVEDENQMKKIKNSIYTNILLNTQKNRQLPMRMNVIKRTGQAAVVNTANYKLGSAYANILIKSIEDLPLQKLNLRDNNLEGSKVMKILGELSAKITEVDLSHNRIGREIRHLQTYIMQPGSKLESLRLDKVGLSDLNCIQLLKWVETSPTLRVLGLSGNVLTDSCSEAVKSLLENKADIQTLYLSWNNFTSKGGELIFKGIGKSNSLNVLDLGWNNLGSKLKVVKGNATSFIDTLCATLSSNTSLRHLTLNNNDFSFEESELISKALTKNTTIYGFHFSGNHGSTDLLGFLRLDPNPKEIEDRLKNSQINGLDKLALNYQIDPWTYKSLLNNCCWICEGWLEIEFTYPDPVAESEPLFILFKHENYEPVYMVPQEDDPSKRSVKIMVPPIKLFFCFLFGGELLTNAYFLKTQLVTEENVSFLLNDEEYIFQIDQLNYLSFEYSEKKLFDLDLEPVNTCLPRVRRVPYVPPKSKKNKRKWNYNNSIFKTFKKDTKAHLDNCFEADFNLGKFSAFIKRKKDLATMKEYLKEHYKEIKQIYKHISSYCGMAAIMCIGPNSLLDLMNKMKVLDNVEVLTADILLNLEKSIYTDRKLSFYQKGCISRFQWLEYVVRLAQNKYMEKRGCESFTEACEKLYNEHIKSFSGIYDDHEWKEAKYWNEEHDVLYTKYLKLLQHLYKSYSGAKTKPGKTPFMCLDEFRAFVTAFGIDSHMTGLDIPLCFNLSMMTQIDEVDSERVSEMSFVEFLEAFAHLADMVSFQHIANQPEEVNSYEEGNEGGGQEEAASLGQV